MLVGVVGLVGQSDLVVAVLAVAQQPGQAADLVLLVGVFDGPSAGEELALVPSGGHAALVVAVGIVAAPCFDQADFAAAVAIAVGLAVGLAVAQHSGQAANLVNGGCLALAASACHAGLVVSVGLVAAPCSAQAGYAVAVALAAACGLCVAQVVLAAAVALPVAPCAVALVVPAGLVPVVSPCQSYVGLGAAAAAAACVAACCCTQWLVVVAAAAARLAQLAVAAHAVNPSPCHCSSFVVAGYPLPVADVAFLGELPPCLSHPLLGIFVFAVLAAAVVDMPLVPPCSAGPAVALPVVGWPVGIAVQWLGQGAVAVLVASGHELFLLLLQQLLLLLGPSPGCLPCWFAF